MDMRTVERVGNSVLFVLCEWIVFLFLFAFLVGYLVSIAIS
jgi:hypothetical protein